jgi:hypothetical protein
MTIENAIIPGVDMALNHMWFRRCSANWLYWLGLCMDFTAAYRNALQHGTHDVTHAELLSLELLKRCSSARSKVIGSIDRGRALKDLRLN